MQIIVCSYLHTPSPLHTFTHRDTALLTREKRRKCESVKRPGVFYLVRHWCGGSAGVPRTSHIEDGFQERVHALACKGHPEFSVKQRIPVGGVRSIDMRSWLPRNSAQRQQIVIVEHLATRNSNLNSRACNRNLYFNACAIGKYSRVHWPIKFVLHQRLKICSLRRCEFSLSTLQASYVSYSGIDKDCVYDRHCRRSDAQRWIQEADAETKVSVNVTVPFLAPWNVPPTSLSLSLSHPPFLTYLPLLPITDTLPLSFPPSLPPSLLPSLPLSLSLSVL